MSKIEAILKQDDVGEEMVEHAKRLGQTLARSLKTNQIRKIFTEVRKIEALWERQDKRTDALRRLVMLKPKLAYQEKRQERKERKGSSPVKPLADELTAAITVIAQEKSQDKQDLYFRRFVEFFEAVLAYHKYFGGKDN